MIDIASMCGPMAVLEQQFLTFMGGEGKSVKSRSDVAFLLLPARPTVRDLLMPCRQRQQNWQQQEIHLLCKGNEWSKWFIVDLWHSQE